jgi:hypothetical protein
MDKNIIIIVISLLVVAVAYYYVEEKVIEDDPLLQINELYDYGTINIASADDIIGCTDPNANNYDEDANIDNGDCIYYVVGCSDINATNYDPTANYDPNNNLCQYDESSSENALIPCTPDGGFCHWINKLVYAECCSALEQNRDYNTYSY